MVITPVQIIFGLTFIILGFEVDSASSECCDSLTAFWPNDGIYSNEEYSKIPDRILNGKPTYRNDGGLCIFNSDAGSWDRGNAWKLETCDQMDGSESPYYLWSTADTSCPEDTGKTWRWFIIDHPAAPDASRMTVLCTGALDPDLTPLEYSVCGDGSCAYVGGDLASTLNQLATSSSQTIEIECCNSGSIDSEIKTCGNGISCSEICGSDTGCVTIKTSSDTDDETVCTDTMDENWCQQSKIVDDLLGKGCQTGGKRKKRGASCTACNTPIWRLSYCVQKVGQVTSYPECCFHPYVRKFKKARQICSITHKIYV